MNENLSTKYIIWGVIQIICCNQITGIATLILALLANSDYAKGEMESHNNKIHTCKILTWVGIITGAFLMLLIFGICFLWPMLFINF